MTEKVLMATGTSPVGWEGPAILAAMAVWMVGPVTTALLTAAVAVVVAVRQSRR